MPVLRFIVSLSSLISLTLLASVSSGAELIVSPPLELAGGRVVVVYPLGAGKRELLVHFHGATETVRGAFERAQAEGVLAVVNFNGLSSAYAQPFARDGQLFPAILRHAWEQSRPGSEEQAPPAWERVTLSSFSAGYGAVREILKTPAHFRQVQSIIAADSIYAGLAPNQPERSVDSAHMHDFLQFARLACEGRSTFVVSHSAQATSYASTTETADYLLHALNLPRQPVPPSSSGDWQPATRAARGRFLVLGFDGADGPDHLQHLRRIDRLWQTAAELR